MKHKPDKFDRMVSTLWTRVLDADEYGAFRQRELIAEVLRRLYKTAFKHGQESVTKVRTR